MKDAQRRLLDLLAGWSAFISEEEGTGSDQESETIGNLYQEVGQFEDMTDEQVKKFVEEKILLLLLRDA
jgi:hypothetical protein